MSAPNGKRSLPMIDPWTLPKEVCIALFLVGLWCLAMAIAIYADKKCDAVTQLSSPADVSWPDKPEQL